MNHSLYHKKGLKSIEKMFFALDQAKKGAKSDDFEIMQKKITLRNEKIEYTLRKHRQAKRLKLAIYCDGNFVVTVPWRMSIWNVDQFIREHADWVLEKMKSMKKLGKNNLFARNDRAEYLELKERARALVYNRLEKFNKFYDFNYKGVAIRNQKTRWGSCSSKGNLNFNYKIVLLPPRHADYIIVHELCHIKEFNHSKRFWNLVAKTIPEYEKIIADLRAL